jgi:hypothetical protein
MSTNQSLARVELATNDGHKLTAMVARPNVSIILVGDRAFLNTRILTGGHTNVFSEYDVERVDALEEEETS